ncbi:MAG: hypothetical protein ACRDZ8_16040 [Acidimicrobiales bacterium]
MASAIWVGVTATRAPWGRAFRAFVRDHASGVTVETLMSASQLPSPGQRGFDVLIVDDQLPLLKPVHIAAVKDQGTHVIGIWDETSGRGRDYVVELGVDEPVPASTPPSDLLYAILRVGPVNTFVAPVDDLLPTAGTAVRPYPASGAARSPNPTALGWRAPVTVFCSVCGGTGMSEAIVAVAQHLSRRARVLVIEGAGATLAQRLQRAPEYGLGWALERVASGYRAFPEALSPGRDDGARMLCRADVICGTAAPSGPPPVNAIPFGHLVDQAVTAYDHIVVEIGPLSAPPVVAGGDRFAVARAVLSRADRVAVFGSADPCGATKLVDWQSVAHRELDLAAPCIAVFGRSSRRRFEQSALTDVLARNTGAFDFDAVRFLPEDPAVFRARWDGVLVARGRWHDAVTALADDLGKMQPARAPADAPVAAVAAAGASRHHSSGGSTGQAASRGRP